MLQGGLSCTTRAHAEMFSKLWPKVSGQVTISLFHMVLSEAAQLWLQLHTTGHGYITMHQTAPKKTGRKRLRPYGEWGSEKSEKQLVEREGEKKKTVGSVSCGCDTGVLINSEGAGVSQHASGPPSHCQASPGAPPFSPKKRQQITQQKLQAPC